MVRTILELRRKTRGRCAFFLHHELRKNGYDISLSSVKRTLQRNEVTKYSKWKKWHAYSERPRPEKPGVLVEVDTIHQVLPERLYVYTLLDVCSRWAYAAPSSRIAVHRSVLFVTQAQSAAPFSFQTIQSDHGSEFSKWFTKKLDERNVAHRHSRIRTPNDNAHLERFNRTIQDECLRHIPFSLRSWQREIPEYLRYYNTERAHMGLDMKTPVEIIKAMRSY
jgi:transposase InsO family protein